MKRIFFLCLLCVSIFGNARAQNADHPWAIGPDLGLIEYGGDLGNFFYNFNTGFAGGVTFQRYVNPSFDAGLNIFYDKFAKTDENDLFPGYGFNFSNEYYSFRAYVKYKLSNGYILKEDAKLRPFLKAGLGMLISTSEGIGTWPGTISFSHRSPTFSFGPGLAIPLGQRVTLELASIMNFPSNADFIDLMSNENPAIPMKNSLGDLFLQNSVSLLFNFGGSEKDSDNDGIPDKKDLCADTPPDVAVDENGCPLDTDGDGIADYLDECPTVAGLEEFNGCPDTDGDGIPDKDDECPDTAGPRVLNGCPDADGDGIADKDDRCPDTPDGWEVDKFGCPLDSDRDGIPDSEDKCPDVAGASELKGCPWTSPLLMTKYNLTNKKVLFDFDSSELKADGTSTLSNIAKALQNHKNFGVHLIGHTDWTGTNPYNMKLSKMRVESARTYLLGNGIEEMRIRIEHFGELKPFMDNSSKKGRMNNRRVDFNFFKIK